MFDWLPWGKPIRLQPISRKNLLSHHVYILGDHESSLVLVVQDLVVDGRNFDYSESRSRTIEMEGQPIYHDGELGSLEFIYECNAMD
jgi:hypothetical protein